MGCVTWESHVRPESAFCLDSFSKFCVDLFSFVQFICGAFCSACFASATEKHWLSCTGCVVRCQPARFFGRVDPSPRHMCGDAARNASSANPSAHTHTHKHTRTLLTLSAQHSAHIDSVSFAELNEATNLIGNLSLFLFTTHCTEEPLSLLCVAHRPCTITPCGG